MGKNEEIHSLAKNLYLQQLAEWPTGALAGRNPSYNDNPTIFVSVN